MRNKLYVISGSSGVGKGTVLREFLKKHQDFELSISCTTRKPRNGEVDGVNYFFISEDEFENNIKNNKFLEWAKFADNFYGTKKKYIKDGLDDGKNFILEIDTQGALQVKKEMPDAVLIFVCPPSFEVLQERLRGRNTESEAAIQKRLDQASDELTRAENFNYKIINDTLDNAVLQLENIIYKEHEDA